jgi:hypothetical protein
MVPQQMGIITPPTPLGAITLVILIFGHVIDGSDPHIQKMGLVDLILTMARGVLEAMIISVIVPVGRTQP